MANLEKTPAVHVFKDNVTGITYTAKNKGDVHISVKDGVITIFGKNASVQLRDDSKDKVIINGDRLTVKDGKEKTPMKDSITFGDKSKNCTYIADGDDNIAVDERAKHSTVTASSNCTVKNYRQSEVYVNLLQGTSEVNIFSRGNTFATMGHQTSLNTTGNVDVRDDEAGLLSPLNNPDYSLNGKNRYERD